MAGAAIAMGATPAGLARSQSFDRAYKGSMKCEQMPAGDGILRTPLAITVRNGRVVASAPMFDIDGRQEIWSAVATGTADVDGVLHFAYAVFTLDAEFHGHYTVTINAAGDGTLIGTQVGTRAIGGDVVTRKCTGTVFEVKSPRQ